jgi:t-SNARE complex subunit (syntaxin)
MKEVSMLVQQQGEMIDNILKNVIEAKDYVIKAEVILAKEKEIHKTSRKKICCIIFLSLAILALILTPIIIKAVKSNSSSSTTSDDTNNSTNSTNV